MAGMVEQLTKTLYEADEHATGLNAKSRPCETARSIASTTPISSHI